MDDEFVYEIRPIRAEDFADLEERARWIAEQEEKRRKELEVDLESYKSLAARICPNITVEQYDGGCLIPKKNKERIDRKLTEEEHNIITSNLSSLWNVGAKVRIRWRDHIHEITRWNGYESVSAPFCFEIVGTVLSPPTRNINGEERIADYTLSYIQECVGGEKLFINTYQVISAEDVN